MRHTKRPGCGGVFRSSVVIAIVMFLVAPHVSAQDAAPSRARGARSPTGRSHIEFRSSAMLSLHMLVRAGAAGAEVPESVRPAVEAVRAADDRVWGMFDGIFASESSPEEIRLVLETYALRLQGEVGEALVAYAEALVSVEPAFRAEIWPQQEAAINEAKAGLEAARDAQGSTCMSRICEWLGIVDPRVVIPVYLVTVAPAPGGFTARSELYKALCIVSVDMHRGSTLVEATLHEAIHALDEHTRQQEPLTVLQALRKALADAGVAATEARMRDVAHTLIFAAAAEVTREVVDPKHVAYGETGGYYAKVPRATEAVLPAWGRYAAGEIDASETIAEIVKIATKPE